MLGLREEIHHDPLHGGMPIADDDDLRRSGEHVDADDAEHEPLRRGHVPVPGSDDLVHRLNRSGPERKGRNCLRASDSPHLVYRGQVRSGKHQRIELS